MSLTEDSAQIAYLDKIVYLHKELGIAANYAVQRQLALQYEPPTLVSIGEDVFSCLQQLVPEAAKSWGMMREAAYQDGITLSVVSAFRSVEYQTNLIRRKLIAGQSIEQILTVNAAPGYSEHHTGRCLDITTPGCKLLEDLFEKTDAFAWLTTQAANFNFYMSFPRDNPHGIIYEPWHWIFHCERETQGSS